ncbi:hypothetical protein LOTGIDRAFT_163812 [Lottia gigantea]|uniref:Uncharacterized protein n=1 Tax=Lottia gigantea TaxID=225164 RepID=V4A1Q9_LOTGI|nr:hypothetical protein LOTGIDRAFT_163812 [Lottia gigantea]ESO90612.1 hypothetical protein LOTGIDRAFT_163812 [Lottia gigantea]
MCYERTVQLMNHLKDRNELEFVHQNVLYKLVLNTILTVTLARLKEEFLLSRYGGSSPDVSTLSLNQDRSTTASQTDLRGEGSFQVSLADFDPKEISIRWFNILNFKFMQPAVRKVCTGSSSQQSSSGSSEINKASSLINKTTSIRSCFPG